MVIKFDPLNKPGFVVEDFLLDDKKTGVKIIGYHVRLKDGGDIRVASGDYFIVIDGDVKVILRSEYDSSTDLKRLVVKEVATQLLEDIIQGFVDLSATDLVKLDILNTIGAVMDMIIANKINAARVIANATPTSTNFTAGRKAVLLSLIDAAILKL